MKHFESESLEFESMKNVHFYPLKSIYSVPSESREQETSVIILVEDFRTKFSLRPVKYPFSMLPPSFYQSFDTITLAQKLLGCTLVHESEEGRTSGIIVETEAYLYDDPASHSFRGQTPRNAPMFGEAGSIYVYLIYGMYECFNIVSSQKGRGEAVLIRALEPTEGIELMQKRRKTEKLKNLCSGPGKLAQAMGFSRKQNGISLNHHIYCIAPQSADYEIVMTNRVGISQAVELPYRFYIGGNRFVSKF